MSFGDCIAKRYKLVHKSIVQSNMLYNCVDNVGGCIVSDMFHLAGRVKDKGMSYKSTMSICSYMNPYTPAKRLALVHSTGTGKTRKALLCALQYNKDITIVAIHSVQLNPFLAELTKGSIVSRIYPAFRKRVDIMTCKSVSTALSRGDVDRLNFYFNDRVVIIDEMHHIRNTGEQSTQKLALFNSIITMINQYRDIIVLFLTATPLVDTASEIVGVYKLLKGKEPPMGNEQYIASQLTGYISMLTMSGLHTENREYKCIMVESGEQWRLYQKHEDDRTSVHSKTSAISRFVTNDDDEASECKMTMQQIADVMLRNKTFGDIAEYYDACIDCLRYVSIKLYTLVRHLQKTKSCARFLFDSWKKRGGADRIVDVLTMPAIGYNLVMCEQDALDVSRGPKLLALHKFTHVRNGSSVLSRLLEIFNSDDNRDGGLIEIVIATPKFAESMSLKTVRETHILSQLWNVTSRKQVEGRPNRRGSLRFLTKEDRMIYNYSYMLYRPDRTETIEHRIRETALHKYETIFPVLKILAVNKIEAAYAETSTICNKDRNDCGNESNANIDAHSTNVHSAKVVTDNMRIGEYNRLRSSYIFDNMRMNNRVRLHSEIMSYRDIVVNLSSFLRALEHSSDLYSLMHTIAETEAGYTKFVNVAIQCLEELYAKRQRGDFLTVKQHNALRDVSKAFIMHKAMHVHILYFHNDATVEYQRLAHTERRIVRKLDTTTWAWSDVDNKDVMNNVTEIYEHNLIMFIRDIGDKWREYGYYGVKYILYSCHRLVKYKDIENIVRTTAHKDVDMRKVSRGEKWQYYNRHILVDTIANMYKLTHKEVVVMCSKLNVAEMFNIVLDMLMKQKMLLVLPI